MKLELGYIMIKDIQFAENPEVKDGVLFVNPEGTSQLCPVCEQKGLSHDTKCPHSCGFDSNGIMHSNDGIAGVNIAKRGLETIEK